MKKNTFWLFPMLFIPLLAAAQTSIELDGSKFVAIESSSFQLDFTSNITLEAWIYPTAFKSMPELGVIIGKDDESINMEPTGYTLRCGGNGVLNFTFGDYQGGTSNPCEPWPDCILGPRLQPPSWQSVSSPDNALQLNVWQHVAATYDGTNVRLYVNGVLVKTEAKTGPIGSNNQGVIIGDSPKFTGRNFLGRIDEVCFWNVARPSADILSGYNKKHCIIKGLLAYFKMDEGSGTTIQSSGCTSLTGHFNEEVSWPTSEPNLLASSCLSPTNGVVFVDKDATGANNGSSWANALTSLATAFETCDRNVTEIWIADGTYKPHASDRNATFHIDWPVRIYGGFNGTETAIEQRSYLNAPTILSGDIGTVGSTADNSYHIVSIGGSSNTIFLNGLTIEGGKANGSFAYSKGSGLFIHQVGGAVYVDNCNFQNNNALSGGAIYCSGYNSFSASETPLVMRGCVFRNNGASENGGVFGGENASPLFQNCIFHDNTAAKKGAAIYNLAMGLAHYTYPKIVNCTFVGNVSTERGKAIYNENIPMGIIEGEPPQYWGGLLVNIINSIIWDASTSTEERVYNDSTTSTIFTNCVYKDNLPNQSMQSQRNSTFSGCKDEAPVFVNDADPNGADNIYRTTDDGFAAQVMSNVINEGVYESVVPPADILGYGRVSMPEIGAYESIAQCNGVPTIEASGVAVSSLTSTSFRLSWNNGNGKDRIVVVRAVSAIAPNAAVVGTPYAANTVFGSGSALGGGFVVYNGNGNETMVTGLSANTRYHIAIFEHCDNDYKLGSPASAFITTNANWMKVFVGGEYVTGSGAANAIDGNTATNWQGTGGNNNEFVIDPSVSYGPVKRFYFVTHGTRLDVDPKNFEISGSNDNEHFTLLKTGIVPCESTRLLKRYFEFDNNVTYRYYKVRFSNPCNSELAGDAPGVADVQLEYDCIASAPTVQANSISFMNIDSTSVTLEWNKGNGLRSLVVVKAGAPISTASIASGNGYVGYTDFAYAGNSTIDGGKVVYIGEADNIQVTNLEKNTKYYFTVLTASPCRQYLKASAPTVFVTTKQWNALFQSGIARASGFPGAGSSTTPTTSGWLFTEGPERALDGTNAKYLNYSGAGSGLEVRLPLASVAKRMEIRSVPDAEHEDRNPRTVRVEGRLGSGAFATIAEVSLPMVGGSVSYFMDFDQNTASYDVYRITVVNVYGAAQMQIKEVQLYGDIICNNPVRLYVKPNGTGKGSSWADACGDLQDAIDYSAYLRYACGEARDIWVAAGVYLPNRDAFGNTILGDNREKAFSLRGLARLFGGFNGTESEFGQRDPKTNTTTLSGDIGVSGNNSDNAYHVLHTAEYNALSILSGFTIRDGNSNNKGGGIYVEHAGNGNIEQCAFINNRAMASGGAAYTNNTAFDRCFFIGNTAVNATERAAIVYLGESLKMENCVFSGNTGNTMVAIRNGVNSYYEVRLMNCTIANNNLVSPEAVIYNQRDQNAIGDNYFVNNIIYGNSNGSININHTYDKFYNNLLQDCNGLCNIDDNISADPLFLNASDLDGADNLLGTTDDGFYLTPSSPCINSGRFNYYPLGLYPLGLDMAGWEYPDSDSYLSSFVNDRGAYEYQGILASVEVGPDNCDDKNGQINLTMTSGFKPFSYLWSTGATSEDLEELPAGNYTVTITDQRGNTATNTYAVGVSNNNGLKGSAYAPDAPSLKPSNISIEAWIYPTEFRSSQLGGIIVGKYNYVDKTGYLLGCDDQGGDLSQGRIRFGIGDGANMQVLTTNRLDLKDKWTHVAAVYDGSVMKIFVNGDLVASNNYSGGIAHSNTTLYVGYGFVEKLDEVRVWGAAISQDEIKANMSRSYVCGPAAYYPFSCSNKLQDASGNGNNLVSVSDGGTVDGKTYTSAPLTNVVYVDKDASGQKNGSSWSDAYSNLQAAINQACPGSEVWVASGTYYPVSYPQNCEGCEGMRDFAFSLKNNVKIYGGFAGNETARSQRNVAANPTILSGDFLNNDTVSGVDSTFTIANNDENAYHVVVSVYDSYDCVLDGFTIKGGNANSSINNFVKVEGREVYRQSGGGAYLEHISWPTFANLTIEKNSAVGYGGGIYASSYSNPLISKSSFFENTAKNGGGIFASQSSLRLDSLNFTDNKSTESGGAVYAFQFFELVFTINNSVFKSNYAGERGGAFMSSQSIEVSNCVFLENKAYYSGGAGMTENLASIRNCVFSQNSNNHLTGFGGALIMSNIAAGSELSHNTFHANYSNFYGGALTASQGGGTLVLANNIFHANTARVGGHDIHNYNNVSTLNVSNCALQLASAGGYGTATFNSINNNAGNLFAQDPLFANPADIDGADNALRTADDGLGLQSTSPCIDAGASAAIHDITGALRVGNPDIGAYESVAGPSSCLATRTLNEAPIAAATYKASDSITSAGTVAASTSVVFEAGSSISLLAGFHAQAGSTFTARIANCAASSVGTDGPPQAAAKTNNEAQQAKNKPLTLFDTDGQLAAAKLLAFPNPFTGGVVLRYQLPEGTAARLTLYDAQGRALMAWPATFGGQEIALDGSGLAKGLYFIVLSGDFGSVSQKLVRAE